MSRAGLATVTGTVVDTETRLRLHGADVKVMWVAAASGRQTERKVETDAAGRFVVCDVEPRTRVFVNASYGGDEGRANPLEVEPDGSADTRVSLDAPRARVVGRVLADGDGAPIASAQVVLGGDGPAVVTDDNGRFTFGGVPPGRHAVAVSHVAFTSVADSLGVELGSITQVSVRLAPNVIPLDPIAVQVRSQMLERAGFYRRQERGSGSFLTRGEIEAVHPRNSSDALRRLPGIRMLRSRYGSGYVVVGRGECPFRYFMNGSPVGPTFQLDDIPPEWLEAIEIYRGASTVPPEFVLPITAEYSNCGIIAIWTRNR